MSAHTFDWKIVTNVRDGNFSLRTKIKPCKRWIQRRVRLKRQEKNKRSMGNEKKHIRYIFVIYTYLHISVYKNVVKFNEDK